MSVSCESIDTVDIVIINPNGSDAEWVRFEQDVDATPEMEPLCGWKDAEPRSKLLKSEHYRLMNDTSGVIFFAAYSDSVLLGFIYGDYNILDKFAQIQMLCANRCARKGVGSKLLASFQNQCVTLMIKWIIVFYFDSAKGFYEKHGYTAHMIDKQMIKDISNGR